MSYNGSGTFQINTSGQPVVAGTVISSTAFNALTADLATGLSTAITKDGQTATTVRIPFAAGISSTLVTDSSSTTTGSIITAGGVGVAKALYVGTTANIAGVLSTTSPNITTSITTPSTSFDLINATATTLNLGGAATTFNVGAATGTMTVANTTLAAKAITASTTFGVTGAATLSSTLTYGGVTLTNAVTGTGKMVLDTSPTLVTPVLGAASATSVTVAAGAVGTPSITTTGDTNTGIFFPAADTVGVSTGGSERVRVDSSGNVGIGTTAPAYKLEVRSTMAVLDGSANIGFYANGTSFTQLWQTLQSTNDFLIKTTAAKYIAFLPDSTERMRIAANGIVTMSVYGVGTATFSAAGVISSVSDETWKIKDGVPIDTDSMLKKLEPGYWYYNDEKKETFGVDRQLGFYAQNVNAAIGPEAAPEPEEGKPWGYYDRSVLAVTVMSLQKALATIESLTARINALENK